jgi:presenilin-like A22 family membrane protease
MNPMQAKDLATAATPVLAFTSLSQINEVAALIGTLLGIAFLLWRWVREARKDP